MIPLILMGAGMAMQAYGQYQADTNQADAEFANARFYRTQSLYYQATTRREINLFEKKAAKSFGETIGGYASGGVALTGSALDVLAGEKAKAIDEVNAIQTEGDFRANLANLKAQQATDTGHALLQNRGARMFGGLLGGAGQLMAAKG